MIPVGKEDLVDINRKAHLKSDVDSGVRAQHHTLGKGAMQAAPGDHDHFPDSLIILSTLSNTAPPGWLMLDGSLQNIEDYPNLYGVFGTTYGGDGVTTFGLPDPDFHVLRKSSANPMGSLQNSNTRTLTEANLPSHTHSDGTLTVVSSGAHKHTLNYSGGDGTSASYYRRGDPAGTTGNNDNLFDDSDGAHTHDVSGATGATGSGTSFSIVPSFMVVNYIVKAS